MKTEKQKMLMGELYNPYDSDLIKDRLRTRLLLQQFNKSGPDEPALRKQILQKLFGKIGGALEVEPPFFCDYGYNITLGENVFFNVNCVILDVSYVKIGSNVLFAPNVQIYSATHPTDFKIRASGVENAKPVTIGSDIWIGGSAIILPGVSIGDKSVIGAGSVVTKDIPPNVLAVGNPCRVIKELD
ncbi:MAG: sugar O-acetyltransferase [Bacteroidales bacterium]|nr:sugar O-acetyltransferase [Bacteroidales bacterium]